MSVAHKLVPAGIVTAVLAGIAYAVVTAKGPCETAIPYRIGTIDPRFGVTSAQLHDAAASASKVWGNAVHHPLFTYDPKAELTVNLTFDWRQQATQSELSTVDRIKALQASIDAMEVKLGPRRVAFEKATKDFSQLLAKHNKRVDLWNRTMGISDDRATLLAEERALQQKDRALSQEQTRLNAEIAHHNKLVNEMNTRIEALKRDGLNGTIFEKGLYSARGAARRIDIYQFEAVTDLVLVLAHEFGHALGLPHGADPHSLMSPYLLSQKLQLSIEDLRILKAYCSAS